MHRAALVDAVQGDSTRCRILLARGIARLSPSVLQLSS